jgi:hypothetical protein
VAYDLYGGLPPHSDGETSLEAAKALLPRVTKLGKKVYARLREAPSTSKELEAGLGWEHETVSARIRELVLKGRVVWSGEVRKNPSGRNAKVWRVTTRAERGEFVRRTARKHQVGHTYLIPFAPVGLNNAYIPIRGRGGRTLNTQARAYKKAVLQVLQQQDRDRRKPIHETYRFEYVFLFTEDEVFTDAIPPGRRVKVPGQYQPRDLSNMLKLVEDSIFDHLLDVDADKDERVEEVTLHKRVCRTLPVAPVRYGDELGGRYPRGVILVRIRKGKGFLWQEPDALHHRFEHLLEGMEWLPEREHPELAVDQPEWYEHLDRASPIRVDALEDYRDWAKAEGLDQVRVRQRMLQCRVAWLAGYREVSPDLVAPTILDSQHLRDSWVDLVGWRVPKRTSTSVGKCRHFDRCPAWVPHLLAQEAHPKNLAALGRLWEVSRQVRTHRKPTRVLVYGAGMGTWAYPFLARDHDVTLVELNGSSLVGPLHHHLRTTPELVPDYDCPDEEFGLSGKKYGVVVCIDLLDRVHRPKRLLLRLLKLTKPGGLLVLRHLFKDRPGRGNKVVWPWIRTSLKDPTLHARPEVQRLLTRNGFSLEQGTFRDELLVLRRSKKSPRASTSSSKS